MKKRTINVQDNTIHGAAYVKGDSHYYEAEHNGTLAEAAAEIQTLLQQLEQTNPTATDIDRTNFVNTAIPATKRDRIISAAQAAGEAALTELPHGKSLKALIEGWRNPQ